MLYEQVATEVNGSDLVNGELTQDADEQNESDQNNSVPTTPSHSGPTTPVTPRNTTLRISVYVSP